VTVYVDNMRRQASVGRFTARWSHLFADTHEELVAFAAELGSRPEWIQHEGTHREHFDVVDGRRQRAIALGAVPISYPRETGALLAARRAGERFDLAAVRNTREDENRAYPQVST
jgi:hypothetical protein